MAGADTKVPPCKPKIEPTPSASSAASHSSPMPITVVHGFTWPEPPAKLEVTADADGSGGALRRLLADRIGYNPDDLELHTQISSPTAPPAALQQTLSEPPQPLSVTIV